MLELIIGIAVVLVLIIGSVVFLAPSRRRSRPPAAPRGASPDVVPGVGDDAEIPRDTRKRPVATIELPAGPALEQPALEVPAPAAGRLTRLRGRLARSQSGLGRGLLSLLSGDKVDEGTWEQIEEVLLSSDVGVSATTEIVESLRRQVAVEGARTPEQLRALLRAELLRAVGTGDRSLRTLPHADRPAVVLVVGVNGTGKTTTCGKLGRLLVADGRSVVLGAADTFRAAAADQLQTWGERVGAYVVRKGEGADPAAVAFDAVQAGIDRRADVVLIDTAGRLHTKAGLMDELGKIKRVAEKLGSIDEVLLVLDATTGQNGVVQAKQFAAMVGVTGIALTKLDGSAKGGIVIAVQREIGIPVKVVGLGEGPDDLAPFEPEAFVDALLADD